MAEFKCVFFSPTEEEVFDEFLVPRVANDEVALQGSLIADFDLYAADPTTYELPQQFIRPGHGWFFVSRARLTPNSLKPDRRIRSNIGSWRPFGKLATIKRGKTINLGTRKHFDYIDPENHQTGWVQHEYERIIDVPLFQSIVVVHLFFDPARNNIPQPQQQANQAHNVAQINAGNQIDEEGVDGQANDGWLQIIEDVGIQQVFDVEQNQIVEGIHLEQDHIVQIVEGGELFVGDIHVEINEADDHGVNQIIDGENQIDEGLHVGQNIEADDHGANLIIEGENQIDEGLNVEENNEFELDLQEILDQLG